MSLDCGTNLTFASASLATVLSKNLTANETALLAAFLTALADNLALIATCKDN